MFFLFSLFFGNDRAKELDRVWNHREPTAPLQIWAPGYKRDENGNESGVYKVVEGRKYQQLQDRRRKED